jgi:hypothetical protein
VQLWVLMGVTGGVVQHEPGGTDVPQPSCMTSRCDLSLSTPQGQPGEGVGATCSRSRRSFILFSLHILSALEEEGNRGGR